jgi:hypothetical protein
VHVRVRRRQVTKQQVPRHETSTRMNITTNTIRGTHENDTEQANFVHVRGCESQRSKHSHTTVETHGENAPPGDAIIQGLFFVLRKASKLQRQLARTVASGSAEDDELLCLGQSLDPVGPLMPFASNPCNRQPKHRLPLVSVVVVLTLFVEINWRAPPCVRDNFLRSPSLFLVHSLNLLIHAC